MAEGNLRLSFIFITYLRVPSSPAHVFRRSFLPVCCWLSLHHIERAGRHQRKLPLQLVWCANDSHAFASHNKFELHIQVTLESINSLFSHLDEVPPMSRER